MADGHEHASAAAAPDEASCPESKSAKAAGRGTSTGAWRRDAAGGAVKPGKGLPDAPASDPAPQEVGGGEEETPGCSDVRLEAGFQFGDGGDSDELGFVDPREILVRAVIPRLDPPATRATPYQPVDDDGSGGSDERGRDSSGWRERADREAFARRKGRLHGTAATGERERTFGGPLAQQKQARPGRRLEIRDGNGHDGWGR